MANDLQSRVDELEHALRVAHRRIEELGVRAMQAEGMAERASVESQLRLGFAEAGMKPDMIEFALADALAKGQWKTQSNGQLVRMIDPHTADVTTTGDYVTPAMWAKSLKIKAPSFFPEQPPQPVSVVPGSGISDAENPWSSNGWNLTKQSRMCAINLDEARRLAAAVGSSLDATSPPKPKANGIAQADTSPVGQPTVTRATFY